MATATARLDAPRLAGLVGATVVIALASSARPDEASDPSVAARFIAPEPAPGSDPSVAARFIAPEPDSGSDPSVAARFIAPEPDSGSDPSVAARLIAPEPAPEPSVAARFIAPEPAPEPSVAARFLAPDPSVAARFLAPDPSVAARFLAPDPSVAARFIAPERSPTPTTPTPDTPEPSTWTSLEAPRALTIRGRQLGFANLDTTDGRITGQRADGPFAPRGPTLLVHYASWCLPCVEELPEVLALARSLRDVSKSKIYDSSDISKFETSPRKPHKARPLLPAIVFVSHDEVAGPQALLASFEDLLAKARLTPADLPPGLSLRADPDGRFFDALTRSRQPIPDPSALPSLWLLDRRGRLLAHLSGPLTATNRGPLLAALEALR